MTFDFYVWSINLNINRDLLLTKDYLPTKFEAPGAKSSWNIRYTRLRETDIPTDQWTDRQSDRQTCAKQYVPPSSKRRMKIKKIIRKTEWNTLYTFNCCVFPNPSHIVRKKCIKMFYQPTYPIFYWQVSDNTHFIF